MQVQRRDRSFVPFEIGKILERLRLLCNIQPKLSCDVNRVILSVANAISDGITTRDLDNLTATEASKLTMLDTEYGLLAARILVSDLHKSTPTTFYECMCKIQKHHKEVLGRPAFDDFYMDFIEENRNFIESTLDASRDYLLDHYAMKNLLYSNLWKLHWPDGSVEVCDRPCYMFMRNCITTYAGTQKPVVRDHVAGKTVRIEPNLALLAEMYNSLSTLRFMISTTASLNSMAPTKQLQLASCFIMDTGDSLEEIMKTQADAAKISKRGGGIGIAQSCIRPAGTIIRSTNGKSKGIMSQMRQYAAHAAGWDQGGDKRSGAFVMTFEPWHGDFLDVMELRRPHCSSKNKTEELFYAVWMPDLFMKRYHEEVYAKGIYSTNYPRDKDGHVLWSLFNSDACYGLNSVFDGMQVCKHCYCDLPGSYGSDWSMTSLIRALYEQPHGSWKGENHNPETNVRSLVPYERCTCTHDFVTMDVFTKLYEHYENSGAAHKVVRIADIADAIFETMRQTGIPYIRFKDHVNRQSSHQFLGTIKASNLCCEIDQYFNIQSVATCTLGSVSYSAHVREGFDLAGIAETSGLVTENLFNVLHLNAYPILECESNAYDYRSIGVGMSGLADSFFKMRIPFLSDEATEQDIHAFEAQYYGCLSKSLELAKVYGPHMGFQHSPAAKGELRFHLWIKNQVLMASKIIKLFDTDGIETTNWKRADVYKTQVKTPGDSWINLFSGVFDWAKLVEEIVKHGLALSLHVALMPTASSAAIAGNNDCFEPIQSVVYKKENKIGVYTHVNKLFVQHMQEIDLWTPEIRAKIENNKGSVMGIDEIPKDIQAIYADADTMKQTAIQHRSSLRHAFVDQGQSLNINLKVNQNSAFRGILFNGWKLGLNTGSYYTRTRAVDSVMQNGIRPEDACGGSCSV